MEIELSLENIDPEHLRFIFKRMDKKYKDECMLLLTTERIYGHSSFNADSRIKTKFNEFVNMTDDQILETYYEPELECFHEDYLIRGFVSIIKEYFSLRRSVLDDNPQWLI